jgi:hypothetical protein
MGPDQMARGIVFSVNQQDSPNQEVELRLRSHLSAHSCTGYEIGWRVSSNRVAYMGIAGWNGKLGDFTPLVTHYGAKFAVSNGDVIEAIARGMSFPRTRMVDYKSGLETRRFQPGCRE